MKRPNFFKSNKSPKPATMDFVCQKCGKKVSALAPGTHHRNHCPFCLFSVHVDNISGDRSNPCGGLMAPIARFYKEDGEEVLVHQCETCGFIRNNRVAGDDSIALYTSLTLAENPSTKA